MLSQIVLKPQDVLLLAKLIITPKDAFPLKHVRLAQDLSISQSEVGLGLKRLIAARLITSSNMPIAKHCLEFLLRGLKYVFIPRVGEITRGLPTAHAAPPLSKRMTFSPSDIYVWPHPEGRLRGQALTPLYPAVVPACIKDPELHELMALIDAIRLGRAREVQIATDEIKKMIRG